MHRRLCMRSHRKRKGEKFLSIYTKFYWKGSNSNILYALKSRKFTRGSLVFRDILFLGDEKWRKEVRELLKEYLGTINDLVELVLGMVPWVHILLDEKLGNSQSKEVVPGKVKTFLGVCGAPEGGNLKGVGLMQLEPGDSSERLYERKLFVVSL